MNEKFDELIQYRVARAKEALEEADILANSGHWNACVNRLYYACFYVVSALLSKHNLTHQNIQVCDLFLIRILLRMVFFLKSWLLYTILFLKDDKKVIMRFSLLSMKMM